MQLALVVNPAAGGGRGKHVLAAALAELGAQGIDPRVLVSTNADEPRKLAREAARDGAQLVVAVGGDGQASAVANGLIGSDATLGVLAAGSANEHARALGLAGRGLAEQVRVLLEPRRERLDVVCVETAAGVCHFLNVGGTGFDSVVAEPAFEVTGDGERIARLPAHFSILPGALSVAVAADAPLR
jgi:diacylglycerol kinase (ATP)